MRERRFHIGVVAGAENGDKDLRGDHFAGQPVDHLHGVARIVDEQLLAGDMNLPQAQLQAPGPFIVALAEPRVAEAVGGCVAILLP